MIEAWAAFGLTPWHISALLAAAFFAGLFDAIAGGGGLVTVPALLATPLPAHMAFGTNKGQAVWGSGAALYSFWRAGLIDGDRVLPGFIAGFIGSGLGAAALLALSPDLLRPAALGLLIAVAVFLTLRPSLNPEPRDQSPALRSAITIGLATGIGFYDGFFGPGTGTFLIIGQVLLLGVSMQSASANAKVVNFASNLAAFGLFAARDQIAWAVALPMAFAQFAGATLGARLAVRGGSGLVRWVVLVVCLALVTKLTWDMVAA